MRKSSDKLSEEGLLASELLKNKVIASILRPRESEVVIECSDGTRFFVHKTEDGVELSIT